METSAATRPRRFPVLPYAIVLVLIILVALAPLGSVMISGAIANANGCTLNEGGAHPCMINGSDWGETLVTMFVLGWLSFVTLPLGGIAFAIWCVVLLAHAIVRKRKRVAAATVTAAYLCFSVVALHGEDAARSTPVTVKTTQRAQGKFEVNLKPLSSDAPIGRMSIDKQFHGDLEATSKGEMLSAMGAVKGSAGYVAIEQVTGVLRGRRGTFFLQHRGVMDRGAAVLSVTVVPDSGTAELEGLSGTMTIDVSDSDHAYTFDYDLPEKP